VIGRRATLALRLGCVAALVALVGGCASTRDSIGSRSVDGLTSALASVPHRSVSPLPTARLASGLIPPTNRWFSGLVFGDSPQPVFPLPLSFGLTPTGFAFGVPEVVTGANTITGEYAPAVTVDDSATSEEVTAYDEASVTIAQRGADGSPIGSVVIAEGSPTVTYTSARAGSVRLGQTYDSRGNGLYSTTIGGLSYGLLTGGHLDGGVLRLAKNQTAVWFAVPRDRDVSQLASHVSALHSASLTYAINGKKATTTLAYHSSGNTMVAALPSQRTAMSAPATCALGSYPTVYGTLSLCAGGTLSWSSPALAPSDGLDASKLTGADKGELRAALAKDLAATPPLPTDSYFGGKALYRLANLLTIAHDVGDGDAAAAIQKQLSAALEKWTTPNGCAARTTQCFVYDPTAKGIVGLAASFGSEQFNDHHFHYGYFLYAASVAARYDPSLIPKIEPVMNLLAADIASPTSSKSFPQFRVFDAYAGHSWASGYAPFADGNNQESSSEAVDAWNGLALWAAVTGNAGLKSEATWLLSSEAASAKADWTNFERTAAVYTDFKHGVVGVNWGAKRDFATWFSADANAKLGIQLIPMSPASSYLGGDPGRIASNVKEATPRGFDVSLGDYLLMYSALGGKSAAASALATARSLPDKYIDGADSRSYLLAWIMTR
jgi:endo-1,3(4)-beta-glucanase